MKKFITQDEKEVTFGDVVEWVTTTKDENVSCTSYYATTLTKSNVKELLEKAIIKEMQEDINIVDVGIEAVDTAYNKIKKDFIVLKPEAFAAIFDALMHTYPTAASRILAIEMAKICNKKRGLKSTELEYVYGISWPYDKVVKIKTSFIKCWDSFGAFCCKEDAEKVADFLKAEKRIAINEQED